MEKILDDNQKLSIACALGAYCRRYPSQTKAAQSLKATSPATVSTIINGQFTGITDAMFRNIARQVGVTLDHEWKLVQTTNFQFITGILDIARNDAEDMKWIIGAAGCGKTTAAEYYTRAHVNTFYVLCDEDMNRGDFLRAIARVIGIRTNSLSTREVRDALVAALVRLPRPLLIFDEADKLSERVFPYFVQFYNLLRGLCGVALLSTAYIRRRMANGLRYDKRGYAELNSRLGNAFPEALPTTEADVSAICQLNGVKDEPGIADVMADAEQADFDLRRVRRAIRRLLLQRENEHRSNTRKSKRDGEEED
jgi:hypothetical protein